MLQIYLDDVHCFDEATETFIDVKGQLIKLEHSLVSVSKWESKWKKPFLSREGHTREETIDYIRFMTITQNVNPLLFRYISDENIRKINDYMDDPMSATTFRKQEGKGGSAKVTTSEEIYYYMTACQIPWDAEKWHLNRLMTLIHICEEKNKPKKKMRKGEIARQRRNLNASRRKKMNSRG